MNKEKDYCVVEPFTSIPYLVHGFGTKRGKEKNLTAKPGLADFCPVSLRQIHSDVVQIITGLPMARSEGDALVTNLPGILLIIKTADCLPILAVDTQNRAIAAVHCGWRGTLRRVAAKTFQTMHQNYGSDYGSLYVALGPCISQTCYEVGENVRDKFEHEKLPRGVFSAHPLNKKKYLLDLRSANCAQILELGVPERNVFSLNRCTHCEQEFFSYRRDREHAGRLINFIGLVP